MNHRGDIGEEPIDVRRYLTALRRGIPLMVAITLVLGLSVFAVSAALPKTYEARVSIVPEDVSLIDQTSSVDTVTRDLSTVAVLITTRRVLTAAAPSFPGQTIDSLKSKVHAHVDANANVIYVTATDSRASRAAAIANAIATIFISQRSATNLRQAKLDRIALEGEEARLGETGGSADQLQVIESRIADVVTTIAEGGADLSVVEPATKPPKASSPHPFRDGALGLVLGVFLAVIIVLIREQLVPRLSGGRELARLMSLPLLATIPPVGGRRSRTASAFQYQAYRGLATAIQLALPPGDQPKTLLVTSALRGEGKTTVVVRLARVLAQTGQRTLIVSADLRHPTAHDLLGLPAEPGLSDVLDGLEQLPPAEARSLVERTMRRLGTPEGGLFVLTSGVRPPDPADLLTEPSLDLLFDAIEQLDFRYVLVDTPALLGVADTQALARRCSAIVYVGKLDRVSADDVVDARDVLDRLDRPVIGAVILGGRREAPSYELAENAPVYEDV